MDEVAKQERIKFLLSKLSRTPWGGPLRTLKFAGDTKTPTEPDTEPIVITDAPDVPLIDLLVAADDRRNDHRRCMAMVCKRPANKRQCSQTSVRGNDYCRRHLIRLADTGT